jgi:hypothetical protein
MLCCRLFELLPAPVLNGSKEKRLRLDLVLSTFCGHNEAVKKYSVVIVV